MAARSSWSPSSFRCCARSPAFWPAPTACRRRSSSWPISSAPSPGRCSSVSPPICSAASSRSWPARRWSSSASSPWPPSSPAPISCAATRRSSPPRPSRRCPARCTCLDAPAAPVPHLDDHWRDHVVDRGMNSLESMNYPPNAPLTSRPDWRGKAGAPADTLEALQSHALDRWSIDVAICNCLYGVQLLYREDMAAAFAKAVNDFVAKEWLDRDPRLRASIVVPMQNTEFAVAEIERCAADRRFVQVLVLAMGEA